MLQYVVYIVTARFECYLYIVYAIWIILLSAFIQLV